MNGNDVARVQNHVSFYGASTLFSMGSSAFK